MTPVQIVHTHLASCLRPSAPRVHRMVIAASVVAGSDGREFVADLILFDGKPAKVAVRHGPTGLWSHQFTELPGGNCCLSRGRWRRDAGFQS